MLNVLPVTRIEHLQCLPDTSIFELLYHDDIELHLHESDQDLNLSNEDDEENDNNNKADSKFD